MLKFIKKIFSQEEKPEIERIKLEELKSWLEKKEKEAEKNEKNILEIIKDSLNHLSTELIEKANILENASLESKKAEERIKLIVRENAKVYAENAKKLAENIKKIEAKNLQDTLEKISAVFSDFEKKSEASYQKATFLIGKEIGDIKETISQFKKSLNSLLEENRQILENSQIIKSIKSKFEEQEKINQSVKEIESQANFLEERKKDKEKAIKILSIELEEMKNSPGYIEKQEKIKKEKEEWEKQAKEAGRLKESINFKQLASIFHVSGKKMAVIKEYHDNFLALLKQDRGKKLIELMQESKISLEHADRIKIIAELLGKQADFQENPEEISLKSSIKTISEEAIVLEEQKEKLKKAKDKLSENISKSKSEIKSELEKINAKLS